ncbi:DNA methylase N-4 [Thermosipho melanesiensis]|uniref:Methyltransferase n=2 Tax=Thermosipho melanesiensis TaxID=46541 RepID=A6LJS7_THEM4|nr:DNA methyltransferase [Thermosipho melanesiensis]ABR30178.1 putative RNA methylase [Thermosipho melanesiensis BI429]APT73378.1 DNA methylase N-4 [Thermosipho melanesiensis]OOC38192.1 DNA methylase N-4 [Thermosipho melanesiensis]OOC40113.1 DNA methylase N-4 [Thermosipho melanesiensis]OOC40165.1 DNA methylase N-4 [Thermosipho melanesiensis]
MDNFDKLEITTVWSFPKRGKWKTHNSRYRGNFAPQIPRNVILRYSNESETILDPMVGSGTTLIEAKILNRKSIGYDINPESIELTKRNLNFEGNYKYEPAVKIGDARNLYEIKNETIDLIITHPPYLNIIKYSSGKIKQDLSNISDVNKFILEFEKIVKELYRVLKENKYCAILIGDTRRKGHYIPLSFYVMKIFLKNRFVLKEDIIKIQHNCQSTPFWEKQVKKYNFYLIMHEHLFVFRKPKKDENLTHIKYSTGLFL